MSTSRSRDTPNVLVIYTDDQPKEWVGCYGGNVSTPNIDRLAAEGIRLDRYYASSPVCSPSRYNALTGRYASRSERFKQEYPPGGPVNIGWEPGVLDDPANVASVLSDHGYTTGIVGKWHAGLDVDVEPVDAEADGRDPETAAVLRENYRRIVDEIEGCGFDEARRIYARNVFAIELPEDMQHHNMEWVTEGAVEFLEAHADDPFFLFVAPTLPHDPWQMEQFESDPRSTPAGYLDEAPSVQPPREDALRRFEAAERTSEEPSDREQPAHMSREQVAVGRLFATWIDDGVGALLDTLDALGIAEETLVVFTSDHGNRAKFSCYDAGCNQPFLARWPGTIEPGRTSDDLASNVDLAPTVFDVTGADPGPGYTVDGRSIAPLLSNDGYERESVFLEITTERAIVTDDGFKYIAVRYPPDVREQVDDGRRYSHWCVPLDDGRGHHTFGAVEDYPAYFDRDQLYDLESDPEEQRNLADDPGYRDTLAEMRALLREYSRRLPHEFGEFA